MGATETQIRIELSPATPVSVDIFSLADAGQGGASVAHAESPNGEMHSLRVVGLTPATTYRYVVTAGHENTEGKFTTAPADDSKVPFSFLVYGDDRTDDDAHAAVIRQMKQIPSDFLVNTGDLVENGASLQLWQRFFEIERDLLHDRCLFTAVGNHELHEESGANFLRFFGDDDPTVTGVRKLYRTIRWENTRFFFLNGMDAFASSDERKWLDAQLAKADAEPNLTWRVVVLHQGVWSSGPHGDNPRLWQSGVVDLFRAHKIDLVLSGHDHIYERGDADGMKYVVSGGGGAPLYAIGKKLKTTRKAESTFHFIETKIDGDKLAMTVRRGDGSLLENCGFVKGGGWDCDGPKKLASAASAKSDDVGAVDAKSSQNTESSSRSRSSDSKCGCDLPGRSGVGSGAALLLAFGVPLLRRRKRSYAD
ncbi:MAG: metallophosphoesterase family protein [Polyangiaceae bacterium]